jgi:hypothetical protein
MKTCPFCLAEVPAEARKCMYCGEWLRGRRPREDPGHGDIGADPGMRLLLPVGRSGWAIAAGYLGLISVLVIPAPLALITGILAIREMHLDPKKHGMGRAIFGIIMGALGTIVLLLVLVMLVVEKGNRKV